MYSVALKDMIEKMDLENCTPDIDISEIKISHTDVNRPALQLAGFFDYFDAERVQIIGYVEYAYMKQMSGERRMEVISRLLDHQVPCIVFCRDLDLPEGLEEHATKKGVPILRTCKTTTAFMSELIRWLSVELAPRDRKSVV